jgi:hypothetical protein
MIDSSQPPSPVAHTVYGSLAQKFLIFFANLSHFVTLEENELYKKCDLFGHPSED